MILLFENLASFLYQTGEFAVQVFRTLYKYLFEPFNVVFPDAWTVVLYPIRIFVSEETWNYIQSAPSWQAFLLIAAEFSIVLAIFKLTVDIVSVFVPD